MSEALGLPVFVTNDVRAATLGEWLFGAGRGCDDLLRRTLRHHMGWDVRQVMNFTDVDDRTIAGAQKAGMPLREYTNQFIDAFLQDAEALGLEPVEERPRATDEANLRAMNDLVAALERNGHTYRSEGSIYYKISTFPTYGVLALLDEAGIKAGARVDSDNYEKEDARDFVLWKATKPGEPTWDYGIGPGRPGWHIECSAMALRLLGSPPIDIHAGGIDLNRQYLRPQAPETLAHVAWLERQPASDLCLCLHEDWESHGFYLYELNPDRCASLAELMVASAEQVCPIDRSEVIEDRPARNGVIRPDIDPRTRPQWPEAFYLLMNKTRLSYTLEAPSDFPLAARVGALVTAVQTALRLVAGQTP